MVRIRYFPFELLVLKCFYWDVPLKSLLRQMEGQVSVREDIIDKDILFNGSEVSNFVVYR